MTFTPDSESSIAGLNVVLRSSHTSRTRQPLNEWLSEFEPPLTWVPLGQRNGVTRIMAVLPQCQPYPELMQTLCRQIGMNTTVEWQGRSYDMTGVEVDSHSLHVLQVPITASEPLPPTLGRAIHATCLHWIGLADESLASRLHQSDTLPIALAMRSVSAKQFYLRIGLLQKDLLSPLLWGLSQELSSDITLTDISCRIGNTVEVMQGSSYEVLSQIAPERVIDLQFLTPTSFKQGKHIQPFPLPDLVFGSLLRRWNTFAPVEFQFPEQDWHGITAAYELKTYALKMKGGAEIGAQGWVRYEFNHQAQAQVATTLSHFAQYASVGRKTAMGMGMTKRIEPPKQSTPRSPH